MAQQDEVSGLRDIIRHDALMDGRALEKIAEIHKTFDEILNDMGGRDINSAEFDVIIKLIKDVERCIRSTLADGKRDPGAVLQIELVIAERPE